jgi:hypothetical protein
MDVEVRMGVMVWEMCMNMGMVRVSSGVVGDALRRRDQRMRSSWRFRRGGREVCAAFEWLCGREMVLARQFRALRRLTERGSTEREWEDAEVGRGGA